ncbi:glycosyltransferase family 2 protein [Acetobacter sicerae]|uniref:Glycosyltransferase family 2 protein n=1 Tax=Acetobacter sicerae TaxID=85325 RepID=A0ABS8W0I8_9PROT|nr:glycosyltransferase family 2 protein [Acetobacter sicerae]MCE0745393.1 glycosyltransferase family 2 protein [Acetobacter sicerae]
MKEAAETLSEQSPRIAVLVPCYNEEVTIGTVVRDFRAALPFATVYVYDNNSNDRTREIARAEGAVVRQEFMQGKGNVIRRMFADIDADYYILVDGDATYEAAAAPRMLKEAIDNHFDMVTGLRVTDRKAAYRPGHVLGNKVLTSLVQHFFGRATDDMLSGYRVFSRRFVKSFPAASSGFETETEFTVHALQLSMPISEIPTRYIERPEGSTSKLNTWSDGVRILTMIIQLVKQERPLLFFTIIALFLAFVGVVLGVPVVADYMRSGFVPRLPTAVLATGCEILAALSLVCGLILDSVAAGRLEVKRLAYISCGCFNAE